MAAMAQQITPPPAPAWHPRRSRRIAKRWVIEGDLVLQTPAQLGNGDASDVTDMPLLVDPVDEFSPLLTGASLAGALRSHLRQCVHGNLGVCGSNCPCTRLFGGRKDDDDGLQSPLIVDDAVGQAPGVEMRDGVSLDSGSRTADEQKLFSLQMWPAGTTFTLHLELLVSDLEGEPDLLQALATALTGLREDGITLGARKRRGYGRASVQQWRVRPFDLAQPQDLDAWLRDGGNSLSAGTPGVVVHESIQVALGCTALLPDHRNRFVVDALLTLDGSLLIRSDGTDFEKGPDSVHLRARQANGQFLPVLSGTSSGGAMRARALRIVNSLPAAVGRQQALVDAVFGQTRRAGRLLVEEHVLDGARVDLVQNRVSIDRATSASLDGALFSQQPAFGSIHPEGQKPLVRIRWCLSDPMPYEKGLLLLLLKDLWTSDLPLGGESSGGRGRFEGQRADIRDHWWDEEKKQEGSAHGSIVAEGDQGIAVKGAGEWESWVRHLGAHLVGSEEGA